MKKQGYYSTGEFMKLAHITKKTIRYYDEQNILKPSYIAPDTLARFYTDADLAKIQQIIMLKYLGFSLADIKVMTINQSDTLFLEESLKLQLKLVEERIDQLYNVSDIIKSTAQLLSEKKSVDWSSSLDVIHNIGLEKSLKNQYNNASNISARINLHKLYSQNRQGWFPWVYEHCAFEPGIRVLELGCGDGTFWSENSKKLPSSMDIVLSDVSEGMLRDAKRNVPDDYKKFSFLAFDCNEIPFEDESFDVVIANHLLFYCEDIPEVVKEIKRILKPDGTFIASTYGAAHMKEVRELVSRFDDRIVLSANKLYEKFGKENGQDILSLYFSDVSWYSYEDFLLIPTPEALVSYVLSCHGNQNQYIIDRYNEFRLLVQKNTENGFRITKDAGIFISSK